MKFAAPYDETGVAEFDDATVVLTIDDYDCDWCGHDHRHEGKCRWADEWDGGAPTLFCSCEKVWRQA